MRKPSAPRPEPSNRSEGTPASIPPRRSGNRHSRSARSVQGGAGRNGVRRSPQAVGPARRPRSPGAGATAGSPGAAGRPASSKTGSRPVVSRQQAGDDSPDVPSTSSRDSETTAGPESAPGAELTVFGRRQVALPRGDDRVVSTGLADRLKERQQALRRLRLRRVATAAIVVLVVVLATWALLFSPLLGLQSQRISIVGSDGSVSDKQVRDVLSPYTGDSLLRLDTSRLSTQVSDKLVRVRQAQVTRSWPRGLRVQLTMRVPVATVQGSDGYQILDNEAVVLERVQEAPTGLVTIMPDSSNGDGATQPQEISAKQVAAVTQVVGSLAPETLAQVASGSATASGQVTLALNSGASVIWGDTQDNALKAQVLATLMATSASVYDVSSPHRPTTRSPDASSSEVPTSTPTP